ncbi:MAG: sigma-70 family RNA polymerase sigma factor [Myxococcales bacterium]|nr:sigma-70 family RNA polymerase sigma factor [Myxococcales bacterium]
MTRVEPPDDELDHARALADGEPAAVRLFERTHRPVVRRALSRALGKWRPEAPVEPEDLVQDFVGFLFEDGGRRLRTFAGRSSFTGWLYTVALRYFQRRLARERHDRRGDEAHLGRLPARRHDPEQRAQQAQTDARVRAVVAELPPSDQLLVRLFFVEGLNASEVAEALGKGKSAVRMRKMRLLERLREQLEEEAP